MNALNTEMIRRIGELIDEVSASNANSLIIVGAGNRAFCAGADVNGILGRTTEEQKAFAQKGQSTFAKLDCLAIPSIAVISGVAFGGGLELAMACTFRVAMPAARLALPEIKLGLIPAYGGTQRLPRLIGQARAMDLIATGRIVGADEAERIGLVHRLVEEGDPVTSGLKFAGELGNPPPAALSQARKAVAEALDLVQSKGFAFEAELFASATETVDATEGITAFLEKRRPDFRGQ
jgi:enoyl-CoA hydratase